jgi:hypothetical protein
LRKPSVLFNLPRTAHDNPPASSWTTASSSHTECTEPATSDKRLRVRSSTAITTDKVNETSAKVYARLELISTKLPIVKDLFFEIVIHASIDELEQYEDGSR